MFAVTVVVVIAALFEKWPGWFPCYFSERKATDHLSKTNSTNFWQMPQH